MAQATALRERGVQLSFPAGRSGASRAEFWITPFDYAGAEGPPRAVESVLKENKLIGMSFARDLIMTTCIRGTPTTAFWNLSRHHTMYGQADQLCLFKLMPLEPQFVKLIEAQWSFQVVDMDRRLVAFKDLSVGEIKSWHWDFWRWRDVHGTKSDSHLQEPDHYVVVLDVEGSGGNRAAPRSGMWR